MKTKMFESDELKPKTTPDGTSLEEKVNAFLLTLASKDILDVTLSHQLSGKFGIHERHFAVVLYKVA